MAFTPDAVHALVVEATAGDASIVVPAADHPRIMDLATTLAGCQRQVVTVREPAYARGVDARTKLAEASRLLAEAIPILHAETQEAHTRCDAAITPTTHAGVEALLAREEHRTGLEKLDAYDDLRQWFNRNYFYQHPTMLGTVDFWEAFAELLAETFAATVTRTGADPAPLRNPTFRFLEKVIPFITGETPARAAIRTRLSLRRPVNWVERGGFPP